MTHATRRLRSLAIALCGLVACGPPPEPGPGLILTGGRIYTSASGQEPLQAIALDGARVVAVGTNVEIRALVGDSTQEMQLGDAAVLPGLYDAWIDLEAVGRWQTGFDLRRAGTPREVQARLREAAARDDSAWIIGWGWDESIWPRPELPAHPVLDAAEPDRPVVLWHHTDRLAWLNGAAMRASGLEATAPEGLLASADGSWSGLVTGPALEPLQAVVPEPDLRTRRTWLAEGARQASAAGYTSVSSAPIDAEAVEILLQLEHDEELGIRIEIRIAPGIEATLPDLTGSDLLTIGAIGLELDGPFGPRLAALEQPYSDTAESGPQIDSASIAAACARAEQMSLRLDVHVHGDAALAAALRCDLITGGRGLIVGADLPGRILEHGAPQVSVAAVPQRLSHDLYFLDRRLGAERAGASHLLRSLVAAGQLVAFASLAPRYPLAPMASTWVAWRRQDLEGYPLDGWNGPERIGVRDAMALHAASRWRNPMPTLAPGATADLVVWSADPFTDSGSTLPQARAMVTLVGGRVIYSRPLVQPDFDVQPDP